MMRRAWFVWVLVGVGCKGGDGDGGAMDGGDDDDGGLGVFELDPDFGDGGVMRLSRDHSSDHVLAADWTDGGVFLVGSTSTNAHRREGLVVKVQLDGTPDPDFGRGGFAFLPVHDQVALTDLVPLEDGGLIVGGRSFQGFTSAQLVARFDASGALDPTFGDGGVTFWEGDYWEHVALARTSDGSVYALSGASSGAQLRRLSADGDLDEGFGVDGAVELDGEQARALRSTSDGKLLALTANWSSPSYLHRLGPNGAPDPGFGQGGVVDLPIGEAWSLAWSPTSGEVLVAGTGDLLKLDGTGRPVQGFGNGGVVPVDAEYELTDVVWLDGGDIALLEASEYQFPEASAQALHRLGPDGRPRTQEIGAQNLLREQAHLLGDGDRVWVAGSSRDTVTDETEAYVGLVNADGSLDATFGADGSVRLGSGASPEVLWDLAYAPDGAVVGMGMAIVDSTLMRAFADGPDEAFGPGGLVDTSRTVLYFNGITVDAEGRTVGPTFNYTVARLLPDGSADEEIGPYGSVALAEGPALMVDVLVDRRQRIVVAGEAIQDGPTLLRALDDGTLDPTFGDGGQVVVPVPAYAAGTAVLEEPDGHLVMAGLQIFPDGIFLARVGEDGSLDTSFGENGIAYSPHEIRPFRLIARRGGGYLASGYRDYCVGVPDCLAVVAFDAAGRVDTSFGDGGIATVTSTFFTAWSGIVELDDGRILIGGAREVDHGEELTVWSLTASGRVDPTFGIGGVFSLPGRGRVTSMLPDGDGVIVGGWRFTEDHGTDAVLMRLKP